MPTLVDYCKSRGEIPDRIACTFSALLRFYRGDLGTNTLPLNDDQAAIHLIQGIWTGVDPKSEDFQVQVAKILSDSSLWSQDLSNISGLVEAVCSNLNKLCDPNPKSGLIEIIQQIEDQ